MANVVAILRENRSDNGMRSGHSFVARIAVPKVADSRSNQRPSAPQPRRTTWGVFTSPSLGTRANRVTCNNLHYARRVTVIVTPRTTSSKQVLAHPTKSVCTTSCAAHQTSYTAFSPTWPDTRILADLCSRQSAHTSIFFSKATATLDDRQSTNRCPVDSLGSGLGVRLRHNRILADTSARWLERSQAEPN